MDSQTLFNRIATRGSKTILRKTQSISGVNIIKTLKLPNIMSPRQGLEIFRSRKCSVNSIGIRLSVVDPLPSINKKSKHREHFAESPINAINEDNEKGCQDFSSFLYGNEGQ